MSKFNKNNEIVKHKYFNYLKEAKGRNEKTLDCVRNALKRFNAYTDNKDYKTFNADQAIAYKKWLRKQKNSKGADLGLGTMERDLRYLRDFICWLSRENGYKSKIDYRDTDYLSLQTNEMMSFRGGKMKDFPTMQQVKNVINIMPSETDIEKRDRAILAFTILTICRASAIVSLKIKHINKYKGYVNQDPREVKTKFGKQIHTFLMPVIGNEFINIVYDWVDYLLNEKMFSINDPLFPKTAVAQDENKMFVSNGIEPIHWQGTNQLRNIFKKAFFNAKMKYYHPHSFRDTLVNYFYDLKFTQDEFKAVSQNYGHADIKTTINNYGYLSPYQQGEILKNICRK